ncbi:MAG TPA: branched-chain amino acid ABC transporter permease [Candidatus Paceibacterota bacterium]|nr:branched-chain amino acid ABC transporter permease [Candidatus Paceibacterota bacterium]
MEYLIHIGILITIYAILAISLNLIVGFTGLISITHAAFFGIGAYATAILTSFYSMNFFLALIIGSAIAFCLSLIIGFILSRFKGDYYALVCFGFNSIIWSIMLNWQSLTRGPLGIPGIPRPEIFGFAFVENFHFLILAIVLACLIYLKAKFITKSPLGRALKAIREDEKALQVFGYRTHLYKLFIFSVGASMAAVAGSLLASYISFVDPSTFTLTESVLILSMIILGGLGSLRGSILGAALLVVLPEALRFVGFSADIAAQMRLAVYGLLLILFMMYRPKGFIGEYKM